MLRSAASTSGRRDSSAPTSPIGRRPPAAPGRAASSSPSSAGAGRPAPRCGTAPGAGRRPAAARWLHRRQLGVRWPGRPRRRARPIPWPGSRAGCPPGCASWRAPPPAAARRRAARSSCAPPGGDHDAGLRQIGGCAWLRAAAPRRGAAGRTGRFPRTRRSRRDSSWPGCARPRGQDCLRQAALVAAAGRDGRQLVQLFHPARRATRPAGPGRCGCRDCVPAPGRSAGPAADPAAASTSRAATGRWRTAPARAGQRHRRGLRLLVVRPHGATRRDQGQRQRGGRGAQAG